ncbi:MAG: hypothetical protein H0X73_07805 [Chthoniobacterales bacterium]|nr:hypothetical protein [Chthoniobacterales bacterium]
MKIPPVIRSVVIALSLLVTVSMGPQAAAIEEAKQLFGKLAEGEIETPAEFEKLAAKAKFSGTSEQAILEARLIFCIKK